MAQIPSTRAPVPDAGVMELVVLASIRKGPMTNTSLAISAAPAENFSGECIIPSVVKGAAHSLMQESYSHGRSLH